MSSQDYFQESRSRQEGQQSLDDNEGAASALPYYWSTQPPKQGVPKEAPAESCNEPLGHSGYQEDYQHGYGPHSEAHDSAPAVVGPRAGAHSQASSAAKRPFSGGTSRSAPAGDSFEYRYRSNAASYPQWSVPSWARPQRQRRGSGRVIVYIILGALLLGPLLHLLGAILAVAAVLLLTLIFPVFLVALLAIPYMLYRLNGRRHHLQQRWRGRWWR